MITNETATGTASSTAAQDGMVGIPGKFWKCVRAGKTLIRADAYTTTTEWQIWDLRTDTRRWVETEAMAANVVLLAAVTEMIGA